MAIGPRLPRSTLQAHFRPPPPPVAAAAWSRVDAWAARPDAFGCLLAFVASAEKAPA